MKTGHKHEAPPRYNEAFKAVAVHLVLGEGRLVREVAQELGECALTQSETGWRLLVKPAEADRQNCCDRKQRDLEAENRALRKQLAQKDEVIDI